MGATAPGFGQNPIVPTGGSWMDGLEGFGSLLQGVGAGIVGYGTLKAAGIAEDQLAWEKGVWEQEHAENREDYLFKRGKQELSDALSAAKRSGASDAQLQQMEASAMEKLTIDNFERGIQQQGQPAGIAAPQQQRGNQPQPFSASLGGRSNQSPQPYAPQAPTNYMQQPVSQQQAPPTAPTNTSSMAGYGKPNMTGMNKPRPLSY